MNIYTISRARLLVFLIIILFSNLIIKAESEAEKRASDRRLREIIAQDEERINREADRIYNERYGPGKQDIFSIIPGELIGFFIGVPTLLTFIYMLANAWEQSYGPIGSQNKIKYTDYYKHFNALRKPLKIPETLPIEQKVFLQNGRPETKNHPNGIHGFNRLVIEYSESSDSARKKEIEGLFKEKKWGVPYLKGIKKDKEKTAESEAKIVFGYQNDVTHSKSQAENYSCSKCGGAINCAGLSEYRIYRCPSCNQDLRFKKESGFSMAKSKPCWNCWEPIVVDFLTPDAEYDCPHCLKKFWYGGDQEANLDSSSHAPKKSLPPPTGNQAGENYRELLKEYENATADRKWKIYAIFKKHGWGDPY